MLRSRCLVFLASLLLVIVCAPYRAGFAQAGPAGNVIKAEASYEFGEALRFTLVVQSDQEITSGNVRFRESTLAAEAVVPLRVSEIEPGIFELETAIDLKSLDLRAFSLVHYLFDYTLADGSKVPVKDFAFVYQDDRFDWQQTGPGPIRISWYAGDAAQAGRLQIIAQQSLASIYNLLRLEAPANLDIYIYNSREDLAAALPQSGVDWTGSYADADSGLLLAALPAGSEQTLLAQQQLPHELMHLVLALQAGSARTPFPAWLEEGLASAVMYFPNADFTSILDNAVKDGSLLEIPDLCSVLPSDPKHAALAYAQTASFVQFLLEEYQPDGIRRLVAAYSSGQDCEAGVRTALGTSLRELDRRWRREELGENLVQTTAIRLGPWLLFLAAILLLPILGMVIAFRQRRKEEQIQ